MSLMKWARDEARVVLERIEAYIECFVYRFKYKISFAQDTLCGIMYLTSYFIWSNSSMISNSVISLRTSSSTFNLSTFLFK